MAVRTAPEGADWQGTFEALNKDYMHYRQESTWRVMADYENVIEARCDYLRRVWFETDGLCDCATSGPRVYVRFVASGQVLGA